MSLTSGLSTPEEILHAAATLFAQNGYYATSLRAIAEEVGVTKAAVLYHFPEKSDILAALARPLLDDLEAVIDAASKAGAGARWAVIEGVLDVTMNHRRLLRMNLTDLSFAAAQEAFDRYKKAMLRGNALVAGPRPTLATRVRAAQALAMIGDPIILFADEPEAIIRREVLRGVEALFGERGTPPAKATRRGRGRPHAAGASAIERARRMYDEGAAIEEIAEKIGVSRATVYRYLD